MLRQLLTEIAQLSLRGKACSIPSLCQGTLRNAALTCSEGLDKCSGIAVMELADRRHVLDANINDTPILDNSQGVIINSLISSGIVPRRYLFGLLEWYLMIQARIKDMLPLPLAPIAVFPATFGCFLPAAHAEMERWLLFDLLHDLTPQ